MGVPVRLVNGALLCVPQMVRVDNLCTVKEQYVYNVCEYVIVIREIFFGNILCAYMRFLSFVSLIVLYTLTAKIQQGSIIKSCYLDSFGYRPFSVFTPAVLCRVLLREVQKRLVKDKIY